MKCIKGRIWQNSDKMVQEMSVNKIWEWAHHYVEQRCPDQILASPQVPDKNITVKKKADFMFVDLKNTYDERVW